MGVALRDLKGKVKRPVRSVQVCLDGELWSEYDELNRELEAARTAGSGAKMGDASGAVEIAERIKSVEDRMRESQATVEFRGISPYQLAAIQERFPAKDGRQGWDSSAGAPALLAACAVEPTTEAEAEELLREVHQAVADRLVGTAWLATTGSDSVPFSVRASALING